MGLALAVIYVALVFLAACFVRESGTSSFYSAARALGANTRLTEADLHEQPMESLDDRLRLKRELNRLVGQYLVRDVRRDEAIKADSVSKWPDLKDVPVTPVTLAAEPDQRVLNRGSIVEVSIGDTHKQLEVVAIVLSDAKWLALFRKSDIGEISGAMKVERVLLLPVDAPAGPVPPVLTKKPPNPTPASPNGPAPGVEKKS